MRLLLDTHTALWFVLGDQKLNARIQDLISDHENDVFVSVVSLWEIAIKVNLNRARTSAMPMSTSAALQAFVEADFEIIPVTTRHAVAVETLPRLHGDPFDRLIAAQAISEPLRMVTHDAVLAAYSDVSILF